MGQPAKQRTNVTTLTETSRIVFNDLEIDFTTVFDLTWWDKGSGANKDGSAWRPRGDAAAGLYPLGDMMIPGYADPNGVKVGVLARSITEPGKPPALVPPKAFRYMWSDQIWMLEAPDGYVALGGVAAWDDGSLPSLDTYRCVRADLVVLATVGPEIWDDAGSGRRDDVSCWSIRPGSADEGNVAFSPTTFIPVSSYDQPGPAGFYALQLPLPEAPPPDPQPPEPVLQGRTPPPVEGPSIQYVVHMPWFALSDPSMSDPERILKSPVYSLVRTDCYQLSMFKNNATGQAQSQSFSWEEGISSESIESFAHSVGVELGMEWSIVKDVFSVSAKLSYNFTYTTSSSHGMQKQTQVTDTLVVAPHTAAAAYTIQSTYTAYRQDGQRIQTVTPDYGVPNSTYDTEYPPS